MPTVPVLLNSVDSKTNGEGLERMREFEQRHRPVEVIKQEESIRQRFGDSLIKYKDGVRGTVGICPKRLYKYQHIKGKAWKGIGWLTRADLKDLKGVISYRDWNLLDASLASKLRSEPKLGKLRPTDSPPRKVHKKKSRPRSNVGKGLRSPKS